MLCFPHALIWNLSSSAISQSRTDSFLLCTLCYIYPWLSAPKTIILPGKCSYYTIIILLVADLPNRQQNDTHPMRLCFSLGGELKTGKDAEARCHADRFPPTFVLDLLLSYYRVMISENPSTHRPQEPDIPAMLYPRGGIKVCLFPNQSIGLLG